MLSVLGEFPEGHTIFSSESVAVRDLSLDKKKIQKSELTRKISVLLRKLPCWGNVNMTGDMEMGGMIDDLELCY